VRVCARVCARAVGGEGGEEGAQRRFIFKGTRICAKVEQQLRTSSLNPIPMVFSQSQPSRGLRHGFAVARLLGLWVRISPEAWVSISCECFCCQVEVSASG
jgi:hypothetical protein